LDDYVGALERTGFQVRTLGPWESVINYYPQTETGFRGQIRRLLPRWLGPVGRRVLARVPAVREWAGRTLTAQDDTPGRMYSFVATPNPA
jgi:hypothetical protein